MNHFRRVYLIISLGKTLLVGLLFVSFCPAQQRELKDLANSLAAQIRQRGKGPVAITSFVGAGSCSAFSSYLVDRLDIFMSKDNSDFGVVTRDRVEEVFREINLSLLKNYDSSTFAKVGKQLGARSIVRGSYTVQALGATVSVAAQILDVETGLILGGDVSDLPYTADIKAMVEWINCPAEQPDLRLKSAPPAGPQAHMALQKQTDNDLQIELMGCQHKGNRMVCEFRATNLLEDREWMLLGQPSGAGNPCRAVDDNGNVYQVAETQLGSNTWRDARSVLPSRVSVLGKLTFVNVPEDVSSLSLLEVNFSKGDYSGKAKFQLHSVAVR